MTTTRVMDACDACGSARIGEVEDRDDSTGYRASEARCLDCGASCEYLMVEQEAAAFEPLDVLTLAERLVASLAVLNYRNSKGRAA